MAFSVLHEISSLPILGQSSRMTSSTLLLSGCILLFFLFFCFLLSSSSAISEALSVSRSSSFSCLRLPSVLPAAFPFRCQFCSHRAARQTSRAHSDTDSNTQEEDGELEEEEEEQGEETLSESFSPSISMSCPLKGTPPQHRDGKASSSSSPCEGLLATCVAAAAPSEGRRTERRRRRPWRERLSRLPSYSSSLTYGSDFPVWLMEGLHRLQTTIEEEDSQDGRSQGGDLQEGQRARFREGGGGVCHEGLSASPVGRLKKNTEDFIHTEETEEQEREEEEEEEGGGREEDFLNSHRRLCAVTRSLLKVSGKEGRARSREATKRRREGERGTTPG